MKHVNPLLDFSGLPRFEEIEAHHVEPALDEVLATNREQISAHSNPTRVVRTGLVLPGR